MKVSTVSCCPCSWPYFLTLSYISGRENHNMEETVKPASLPLKSVNQSLCPSQAPPVSINTPSDTTESVKSPNMSTDSGFEGENNRPSLLQTVLPSPSKDIILSSWRSKMFSDGTTALNFDESESTSPKSPKKSTDDSDFNESPYDKKSVPSVGDGHSESDNECGSEHACTFFSSDASWVKSGSQLSKSMCDDKKLDSFKGQISAFSICLSRNSDDPNDNDNDKNGRSHVEFGECLTCHKVHYIRCRNCVDCAHCSQDVKWSGTLSSIRECKDHVIYAEGEVNSEDDYDLHCKPDTETESSDEKVFDATYSDETLSAYYVPSNVSVAAEEYHLSVKLPDEKKSPICETEESYSDDQRDSPCLCHIGMCKSERCQNERSKYTTVLKPKAVRPPINPNRDYHSSIESLHSQHVVAVIGQHHDRLSAFHERPSSSLSQNEGMHYFFSRSLDMPPSEPLARHTTSQLSVATASNFPTSNSCLFSETSGHRSSLSDVDTLTRKERTLTRKNVEKEHIESSCKTSSSKSSHLSSSSTTETESPKTRAKRFSMPWEIFSKSEASQSQQSHYDPNSEPIHMTLEEVHTSLQTLNPQEKRALYARSSKSVPSSEGKSSTGFFTSYLRQKKCKREDKHGSSQNKTETDAKYQRKSFPVFIKSAFNNFFGIKKNLALPVSKSEDELPATSNSSSNKKSSPNTSPFTNRALPPLPVNRVAEWDGAEDDEQWTIGACQSQLYERESQEDFVRRKMDYAASIERVKDCGWYWGPISGETAEKLLAGEPDGSFVVRDSSDEHYIFSLTFKLNGLVRHVRIEHDHGNFSFGCLQKFRSNTIVDFIDSAVAHSRSGRYLFFLHRRPILGPMRVQLLHPVSRFKQVQSLQHMCRFIILKTLRRDLIDYLPLPRRLKDYLNTPHYYSEELATQSLLTKKCPDSRSLSSRSSQSGTTRAESVSSNTQSNPG
ncbi:Suppressor of cytokine signaling 7 like protein [Argiope bruennichi]|uniref:Suppressor of cytokine signaling 7 like protein n=1 Tax=Argiope bruennichi TaxID=94029 RepID=A0A8T0FR28_ARGBR|nr:Suppressor of cytokine signaling 7 like protein [Argiope bruennichi]